jgi:uncharacterized protein YrrD
MQIRPGAQVIAGTDQIGKVARLVYRPDSSEVVGIIVTGWIVLGHDVFVPIEAIERTEPDAVHLALSLAEVSRLPPLEPGDASADVPPAGGPSGRAPLLRAAASGQMPVLAGGRPLRAGQKVIASDGEVGRLDLVLIDPRTGRATGFVVRKGTLLTRDVIVPIELVQTVEHDRIALDATKAQVDRLPEYRPDDEITRDVVDALWYRSGLGPADVQFVEVHTRDGIVELTGHTHTEATKRRIADVARRVRGVLDVRNHLDTFEALEEAVREARRAAKSRDRGAHAATVESSAAAGR